MVEKTGRRREVDAENSDRKRQVYNTDEVHLLVMYLPHQSVLSATRTPPTEPLLLAITVGCAGTVVCTHLAHNRRGWCLSVTLRMNL